MGKISAGARPFQRESLGPVGDLQRFEGFVVDSVKDELRDHRAPEAGQPGASTRVAGRRGVKDGELTITVMTEASGVTLELNGSVDLSNATTLESELQGTEQNLAPKLIEINLAGLDFIDTTGLSKLIAAANRAYRGGWSFRVGGAGGQVARALEITGLAERFDAIG